MCPLSLQVNEFPLTCRICLKLKDLYFLIPLSLQVDNSSIIQLIKSCSSVNIDINDSPNLPQKICHQCLEQLKIAKEIKEKCILSQETLKNFSPNEESTQNLVFIDIVKQEEVKNETVVKFDEAPLPPELEQEVTGFDNFYDDDFAYDSPGSDTEIFKPTTIKTRLRKLKVVIPRLDPCSYDNPHQTNFMCDGCGQEFLNRTNFMVHFKKEHKRNRVNQCRICKQTFR